MVTKIPTILSRLIHCHHQDKHQGFREYFYRWAKSIVYHFYFKKFIDWSSQLIIINELCLWYSSISHKIPWQFLDDKTITPIPILLVYILSRLLIHNFGFSTEILLKQLGQFLLVFLNVIRQFFVGLFMGSLLPFDPISSDDSVFYAVY